MKNSNTVTKKDVRSLWNDKQCVDILVNILNSHHECKDSHIFIGQEHFDIWKVVGQYKAKLIWAYWNTEENDNETCDFCNNLGYASTYNTQDEKDEIQRCDECFYNNKPWAFASDTDAQKKEEEENNNG